MKGMRLHVTGVCSQVLEKINTGTNHREPEITCEWLATRAAQKTTEKRRSSLPLFLLRQMSPLFPDAGNI